MDIKQIYDFVNDATATAIGDSVVVAEDLSNLIDVGTAVLNANAYDKYVNALVSRIGKTIFVNRVYAGSAPSVMMDGWEFGSVKQKISAQMPEARENETWQLVDGASYDPHVFHAPKGIKVQFYDKYVTFDIDMSFTEEQLKCSFINATQMNSFISMLYTQVENSMTVKIDELVRRTINNMIGETVYDDYQGQAITGAGGAKAINLLKLYNDEKKPSPALTAENAMKDLEFLKFASYKIRLVSQHLTNMSTIFNIGNQQRFTPRDLQHIVLLSDFKSGADVYLQSDTFHNELSKLPEAEEVSYWQGTGTEFDFDSVSTVDISKTATGKAVRVTGVIGVIFDRWALGVSNVDKKTTSQYTPNAEFFTNFYKYKAAYYNDLNENFVVFFVA